MKSKSDVVKDRIVVSANVAAGYEVLDNLFEGCQIIGYDWRYLYVNDAAVKQGKTTKKELLGKNMMEAYPSIKKTRMFSQLRRCMSKRIPACIETEFTYPNGKKGWLDLCVQAVPEGIFIRSIDITERKKAETHVNQLQEYLQLLVNRMPIALTVWDTDFRVKTWNPSATRIFGFSEQEALGKHPYDLIVPKQAQPHVDKVWSKLLKGNETAHSVNENVTKDGKTIICSWTNTPLKSDDDTIIGVLSMTQDITERKKIEEEINLKAQLLDATTDSIFMFDFDGNIIYANQAAYTTRGYSRDELLNLNLHDLDTPEYAQRIKQHTKELMEKGSVLFESAHLRKDGSVMPVEVHTRLIEVGEKKLILSNIRDITERRRLEEESKTILSTALDGFTIKDAKGHILNANDAYCRLTGYSRDELQSMCTSDVEAAETPEETAQHIQRIMKRGYGRFETRHKCKDGKIIDVEVSVNYLNGQQNGRLFSFVRDVTERKQMEEKLRQYSEQLEELVRERTKELLESEKRYSVLVEEASDGVAILQDGKIVFANKKGEEIVGYSRDELFGIPFLELVSEEYRGLVMENYAKRLRGEKAPSTYEIELIAKSGEKVPVELSAAAVQYMGRPADLIVVRDVRPRKRLEEERLRLEKLAAIGTAAAWVGHDLRNPLQAIKNATYVLKHILPQGPKAPLVPAIDKAKRMIDVIDDSVGYADGIVNDLRDFSSDRKNLSKQVDINMLIDENLRNMKIPNGVTVKRQFSQVPLATVDSDQIKRVFQNLVQNAVQAMENEGTLTVVSGEKDGFVKVAFNDTGAGISRETMEKLFTPFFTTKAQGMGMGLAICKKFVEANGGTIAVESQEGEGTTFTVKLPIRNGEGKT